MFLKKFQEHIESHLLMISVYNSTLFPWFVEDPGSAWIWQGFGCPSLTGRFTFFN